MASTVSSRQGFLAFCISLIVGTALTGDIGAASCLSPGDRILPPGEERPGKHPEFSEGFRASQRKNWLEAAEWMCKAEEKWPEDGELTRTHGRVFIPYLPRYYLGVALYEIGCYQAALDQFNASILHQREVRNTEREREKLLAYKEDCSERVRRGEFYGPGVDCSQWLNTEDSEDAHESEGDARPPHEPGVSGATKALPARPDRLWRERPETDRQTGIDYDGEQGFCE